MGKIKSYIKNVYSNREGENFIPEKEDWTAIVFGRIIAIPLVRGLVKLPIKINPNVFTYLSIPFALIAAYFFFNNQLILGAILYLISYIFDCIDGMYARITNSTSEFGAKLDNYVDRINHVFLYFGLWHSQYYLNDQWLLGGAIIFIHYLVMLFGKISLKNQTYKTVIPRVNSYYSAIDEGNFTFFVAPLLGIFRIMLPILVGLQIMSFTILFLIQKKKSNFKT
jgi:phosphatidylglycerophosphate synthase